MKTKPEQHTGEGKTDSRAVAAIGLSLAALAVFSVVAFFWWTLVPQLQSVDFLSKIQPALEGPGLQAFLDDNFIWSPNTYVQGIMRMQFLTNVFSYDNQTDYLGPNPLLDKGIAEMQDFVEHNPSRYDYYVVLGKANDAEAMMKDDPSYLKVAEGWYQKALTVVPERQDIVYPYSINLINQGRSAEAIALLDQTVAQDPNVPETYYRLGEAYALIGTQDYVLALQNLGYALAKGFNPDSVLTREMYQKFMRYFYAQQDLPHFTAVIEQLATIDPAQTAIYQEVMAYIDANHRIPLLNITVPQ